MNNSIIQEILAEKKDSQVLEIIFKNHGDIFGGYIRDRIASRVANDIDVLIPFSARREFEAEMTKLYPVRKVDEKNGATIFTGSDACPCEVFYIDEEVSTNTIGLLTEPDVDINTLSYNPEKGLRNWITGDQNVDVIVDHIKKGICAKYSLCDPRRLRKIKAKGWIVLPEEIPSMSEEECERMDKMWETGNCEQQ